ncbi:PrgI family protein [Candidatus Daviesbacteria bacterium]|nr:PrgI family protein [Candidatus Daviesbacteria bacterium]
MAHFSRYMISCAMEQHPVPRDVTSFEFHLVGDMTLKQFMYLAVGLGLAYLFFATLLSKQPFIAVPLIAISGLSGAAFAFLPISDRPLDHWMLAFFKAVYSPTQGLWSLPSQRGVISNRLQTYLASIGALPIQAPPAPTITSTTAPKLSRLIPVSPPPPTSPNPTHPSSPATNQLDEMSQNAKLLLTQLAETTKRISEVREVVESAKTPPANLSQVLQPISGTLKSLASQTEDLLQQTTATSRVLTASKPAEVKVVQSQAQTRTQIMLTSFPNIVNGVVGDRVGNYLEGVIVSIHDQNGLPVRALKTNKLGQFVGATPLPSGVYTITMEKDGFEFDNLQITLTGETIAPLKIIAKQGTLA